jgi:hypothetical protein
MSTSDEYQLSRSSYVAYGTVMFFILCLGLAGNLLTIPVLLHRDHRRKKVTPLMLNMCIVDILLCAVGYRYVEYIVSVTCEEKDRRARNRSGPGFVLF